MKRLLFVICRVFGHNWNVKRVNQDRARWYGHISWLCGRDADCARCAEKWRDYFWNRDELNAGLPGWEERSAG